MAIELFYTKSTDLSPRKWYDAHHSTWGSHASWMCFMHYMERKYLPPYPSDYTLREYNSRFTATMFWNGEGDMPMQEIWDLQLSKNVTLAERLTMQSIWIRHISSLKTFQECAKRGESMSKKIMERVL